MTDDATSMSAADNATEGRGSAIDLREHFDLPTLEDWRAVVERELRGKDYSRLVHETDDHVKLPPVLDAKVLPGMPHFRVPMEYPRTWFSCRRIVAGSAQQGNTSARAALEQGVDVVRILPRFDLSDDALSALVEGLPRERALLDPGVRGAPRDLEPAGFPIVGIERATRTSEPGAPAEQLAHAIVGLVAALRDRDPEESVEDVARNTLLALPVATELLQEIAKFRAARLLALKVVEVFGRTDADCMPRLYARTSRFTWTRYDPHTNLLRHTLGAFAAAAGGADFIEIAPFDGEGAPESAASWRLALNQSRLLAEEAHVGAVADSFGGSYVIEHLTHSIARRAWKMVQRVDAARRESPHAVGPMLIEEHVPIADTLASRLRRIRRRRSKLVGVTAFADPSQERHVAEAPARLDAPTRLAAQYETLRDATAGYAERTGRRPLMLLLPVGPLGGRRARADYASDLLRAAGLDIFDPGKIEDLDQALAYVETRAPTAVVLCGDDDSYAELAPALAACVVACDPRPLVYVVGRKPTDVRPDASVPLGMPTAMTSSALPWGVDGFLHPGVDAVDILSTLLSQAGISE